MDSSRPNPTAPVEPASPPPSYSSVVGLDEPPPYPGCLRSSHREDKSRPLWAPAARNQVPHYLDASAPMTTDEPVDAQIRFEFNPPTTRQPITAGGFPAGSCSRRGITAQQHARNEEQNRVGRRRIELDTVPPFFPSDCFLMVYCCCFPSDYR